MNVVQARQSSWLQGCAIPQARVRPMSSRHPLVHNLLAILSFRPLDPPPIPARYIPGVPLAPVRRRLRTPISNYVRGSTEPLVTHASSDANSGGAVGSPRPIPVQSVGPSHTSGSTGPLSAHHSLTAISVVVKTETVSDIDLATPPPSSLVFPGRTRARVATPPATPVMPIIAEHVGNAETTTLGSQHPPVSLPDATMDVDSALDAAEELGATDADSPPAAVILEASRLRRTRARARAENDVSSFPKPPVRRSSRIRDRRAGTAGEKFVASYGAQAAIGVKVKVASGEKRKQNTRVGKISKKRKTD